MKNAFCKFKRASFCIMLAVLISVPLFGCGKNNDERLKIVTTLFPQYDFATQISGGRAEVSMLLPYGSEVHTYEPSVKDMMDVTSCDIFIYTGSGTEPWAASLLENADEEGVTVLDLSQNITLLEGDMHEPHKEQEHGHDYDPHIWTSPKNAMIMIDEILSALCTADEKNAEYYIQNAQKLKVQISVLDEELKELSAENSGKTMYFGGKFAFLYLFSEYGFEHMSPYKGCSDESEPSIKEITEVCEAIKADNVKYIFTQEMSENKVARSIAEETGTELLVLHSCHNLSRDEALAGETYVTLMRKNIGNMRRAMFER